MTSLSVRLVRVDLADARWLRSDPASFAAAHGLTMNADAAPPDGVVDGAIERLESEPQHAFFHAPRLYVVDGTVAGSACFKSAPVDGAVEIGYGVAPEWQHRGVGTAACRLLCAEAFAASATTVIAHTRPDNEPSWRLLETAGFVRDGETTDPEDGLLWIWRCDRRSARASAGRTDRSAHALP